MPDETSLLAIDCGQCSVVASNVLLVRYHSRVVVSQEDAQRILSAVPANQGKLIHCGLQPYEMSFEAMSCFAGQGRDIPQAIVVRNHPVALIGAQTLKNLIPGIDIFASVHEAQAALEALSYEDWKCRLSSRLNVSTS